MTIEAQLKTISAVANNLGLNDCKPVFVTVETNTLNGVEALKQYIAGLNVQAGWLNTQSETLFITQPQTVSLTQPLIDGELIAEQGVSVMLRYQNNDSWQSVTTEVKELTNTEEQPTHVATSVRHRSINKNINLQYFRLWAYSAEKGSYVERAVLTGLQETNHE